MNLIVPIKKYLGLGNIKNCNQPRRPRLEVPKVYKNISFEPDMRDDDFVLEVACI